jgi:hypothetical protein
LWAFRRQTLLHFDDPGLFATFPDSRPPWEHIKQRSRAWRCFVAQGRLKDSIWPCMNRVHIRNASQCHVSFFGDLRMFRPCPGRIRSELLAAKSADRNRSGQCHPVASGDWSRPLGIEVNFDAGATQRATCQNERGGATRGDRGTNVMGTMEPLRLAGRLGFNGSTGQEEKIKDMKAELRNLKRIAPCLYFNLLHTLSLHTNWIHLVRKITKHSRCQFNFCWHGLS